jgi:hypothetical protein
VDCPRVEAVYALLVAAIRQLHKDGWEDALADESFTVLRLDRTWSDYAALIGLWERCARIGFGRVLVFILQETLTTEFFHEAKHLVPGIGIASVDAIERFSQGVQGKSRG